MHNVIVSPNPILAYGLSVLIKANFPVHKISIASSIAEALEQTTSDDKQPTTSAKPDILLLDQTYLKSLNTYRRVASPCQIPAIIVFDVDGETAIALCEKCEVDDFVLKNDDTSCIIDAIQMLVLKCQFQEEFPRLVETEHSLSLSNRQVNLADLLLRGYSNKEMAHCLNLSYGTVKNYMFTLMRLTSVRSRLELAIKLRERGYRMRDVEIDKIDSN